MSNNSGFMNFPIETAAAFPSQTAAALHLPSTVQSSLDPLSVNDPWASAVAVRPVQQQQHQTQVPLWPQLQGTEFWPQTGQPQQWSTPRSPLGLTGPPPTTLQGMSADNWQSPLPPPQTWDANPPGFGSGDSGLQDASLTGWNASGKGYKVNEWYAIQGNLGSGHDTEVGLPGTRCLGYESSVFGDTTPVLLCTNTVLNCTKHCPSERLVGVWRINFSEDQICSSQGFDLIVGTIRHSFRSYLEAEPEVQAEIALYQSTRSPKGTFVEYTSRISNKLREMESGFKEFLPPKLKSDRPT